MKILYRKNEKTGFQFACKRFKNNIKQVMISQRIFIYQELLFFNIIIFFLKINEIFMYISD